MPLDDIVDLIEDIALWNENVWNAIAQCTVRLPESGPVLLAVLEHVADHGHATDEQACLAFAALHIFGSRRVPLACPLFLRLLRRSPEDLDDLLGSAKTETLPLIAAGVFDGDADAFFAAIMDTDIDELIRFGLFEAVAFLTWDGLIQRETTARFLQRFDAERGAEPKNLAWSGWEFAISILGLRELAPQVATAFRDGRIDTGFGNHAEFIKTLERAEAAPDDIARFDDEHLGYIENLLAELQWFTGRIGDDEDGDESENSVHDDIIRSLAPVSNPTRHVGRNDPCPCGSGSGSGSGSGKKYKKCCLGKVEN